MSDHQSTIQGLIRIAAATVLLGLWLMLPPGLMPLRTHDMTVLGLGAGLNGAVFLGATRPLWRGHRPTISQDVGRGLVLVPCLLFHCLTVPSGLFLLLFWGW